MEWKLSQREALRYLGCGDTPPDEGTAALLARCVADVKQTAVPRFVHREFEITKTQEEPTLKGTDMALEGQDIRRHLMGCGRCVLLAATLGGEMDRLLRLAQVRDMAYAVVLDACATSAIEGVLDAVQEEIARTYQAQGKGITWRFSPGYGDMPLLQQREFVRILDTHRKIGLSLTGECLLTPSKSVTAVIGVTDLPGQTARGGCGRCNLKENCAYRAGGHTCRGAAE